MADKCLTRIQNVLQKSSVAIEDAENILNTIKKAQSETKIKDLDEKITASIAEDVFKQRQIQKKINRLNALEDEVKIRNSVEYVLKEFPNNPQEGLTAILVGSNLQKKRI
jgi:DNA primase catalytic subunit